MGEGVAGGFPPIESPTHHCSVEDGHGTDRNLAQCRCLLGQSERLVHEPFVCVSHGE